VEIICGIAPSRLFSAKRDRVKVYSKCRKRSNSIGGNRRNQLLGDCWIEAATQFASDIALWLGHGTNRSIRTEQAYVNWIRRCIYFHHVRHPAEMSAPQVQAFLIHLAVEENVAAL
jgi:hypothetical protein